MDEPLRDFLTISYNELEVLNLEAKKRRIENFGKPDNKLKTFYTEYLKKEKRIKAVTVGFTDLEGKFQMLDYNKDYILDSSENLTFDGSSVKGFTQVSESDLKLKLDWSSFYWLPSDIFGPGKVLVLLRYLHQMISPILPTLDLDYEHICTSYIKRKNI